MQADHFHSYVLVDVLACDECGKRAREVCDKCGDAVCATCITRREKPSARLQNFV